MSNEIKTRPLTPTEQKYTYAQSMQLEGQTGTIGHLRGDFATTGYGFYTTWFDTRPQWKSDEFKADLDTVINALREDKGLLHNRYDMSAFARHFPESAIKGKGYAWHTAIGLQAVDGLKTSKYLIDTAIKNIEGDISIDEAQELLNTYYEENPKADIEDRTEEADKVAVRIAKILSEKAFSFTPNEYISIHKKLFTGIYGHAGKLRDYNITKKEWVLNGATILYGSASELRATLDYDFAEENTFAVCI